jgi:signal transduction histidine kinase
LGIYTDDKKLSQILRNHISNALKFTSGGEVRVMALLGGRVRASSEPGKGSKGSRFWVAMPLCYGGGTASATTEGV